MASNQSKSSTSHTDSHNVSQSRHRDTTTRSRRNSTRRRRHSSSMMLLSPTSDQGDFEESRKQFHQSMEEGHEHHEEIAILSTDETAGHTITPFLAKHLPTTYNPIGQQQESELLDMEEHKSGNTKFCNRHRPDRKCRKQADGPSMEQLQTELSTLSSSDQAGISHVWSVFSAAPAPTRQLILKGLLSISCFPQLSYIAAEVRDLIKIDFIGLLPPELSLKILCKLDTISLTKAAQVSRKWRQLADDDVVWHLLCEQHIGSKCRKCGWGLPLMDRKRLRSEKRQIQIRAGGRGINEWSPEITPIPESRDGTPEDVASTGQKRKSDDNGAHPQQSSQKRRIAEEPVALAKRPWKDVYKSRFKISRAWKHGRHSLKVLKGHTNGVTCLQLRDNVLASGSYDRSIILWDLESGKEIMKFEGHESGIRCLYFNDKMLVSGGLDRTIKLWDIKNGTLKKELHGPQRGVLSIHNDEQWLVAGSMDHMIYVWNTVTREQFRLCGHKDFVNCVRVDAASRTLFSSSDDTFVFLWDLDTRRVIRQFSGHVGPVQQVLTMPLEFEMDESDLMDVSKDYETDTDLDQDQDEFENGQRQNTLPRLPRAISPLPPLRNTSIFPDDPARPSALPFILTAGLDGTIRLWHVPTSRCLRTYFGHLEGIWSLAADAIRIVSAAEDSMVKVWNPLTGRCEKTYTGHEGPVTSVALSGERLISGGEDNTIRVLEFCEGEEYGNGLHRVESG